MLSIIMQEHGHMEAEYHWSSRWSSKKTYLRILKLSVSGQKATASNIDLQTLYAEKYIFGDGTTLMNVLHSAQTHISQIQFTAR